MFTLTCKLTFPDGKIVTGKVSAESPHDDNAVIYTGAVDRLPDRYETAFPSFLAVVFKNAARETGATFSERSSGNYDCFAL